MKYIGKYASLFSQQRPTVNIDAITKKIGVVDKSRIKLHVKVNKKEVVVDPIRSRWLSTRYRARKRGYQFTLTEEHIAKLLKMPCVYCLTLTIPQLDRKDNLQGYTIENVVPACKRCNTVKSMYLTYDEMMKVAKTLGWRRGKTATADDKQLELLRSVI
jgi:hypothetical protein